MVDDVGWPHELREEVPKTTRVRKYGVECTERDSYGQEVLTTVLLWILARALEVLKNDERGC